MILLTDGVPSPGDYGDFARRIAESGMTISTVSIGKGAEQDLLKDIAPLGQQAGTIRAKTQRTSLQDPGSRNTRPTAGGDRARSELPAMVFPGACRASSVRVPRQSTRIRPRPARSRNTELLLIVAGSDPLLSWWRGGQAGLRVA